MSPEEKFPARLQAWAAVNLAAAVAFATVASATPAHAESKQLDVGFIAALTGPGQSWGMGMLGGLELAAEDVNGAGGIKAGGDTYTINVIAYDSKYAGPGAAQAAQRLVSQDDVKIIFGPLGSVPMLAIADITESAGVLVLSNSYTMKALNPSKKFTFRLTPTTAENAGPMVDFLAKQLPNAKSVAILSPNDESGKEVVSHASEGYKRNGIEVQTVEYYERSTQDFVPILTKIMAGNPDMIDLDGSPPSTSGVIMKQARQAGFKGQFVKVGGPGVLDTIKVAEGAAEGLYYYSPWNPEDPQIVKLAARFEKKYGSPMNPLGVFFYEGGHMLFKAMAEAGSVDPEVLRKHLESQKGYEGIQGTYVWGGEETYGIRHQWIAPFYVGQVQDGKEVIRGKIEQ